MRLINRRQVLGLTTYLGNWNLFGNYSAIYFVLIELNEAGGFQWNCGLVIGRVSTCWVQIDSSGDDLHFIFWVGNDRMKRPHANGRRRTDAVASPAPVPRKLASRRPGWFTWTRNTRNGAAGGPSICIFTRSVQKWAEREAIRGRSSFIRRLLRADCGDSGVERSPWSAGTQKTFDRTRRQLSIGIQFDEIRF